MTPEPNGSEIALIADIHGDTAALVAVLNAISEAGIKRVWCLGDTVDWLLPRDPARRGDPAATRIVKEHCENALAGNHEAAMLEDALGTERLQEEADAAELLEWLRSLPAQLELSLGGIGVTLVHGSPSDPLWGFIETDEDAGEAFALCDSELIVFGHTHLPYVASLEEGSEVDFPIVPVAGKELQLDLGSRWLVNPGSIGRAPTPGLASWARLSLRQDGAPQALSWQRTRSLKPPTIFSR